MHFLLLEIYIRMKFAFYKISRLSLDFVLFKDLVWYILIIVLSLDSI